MTVSGAVDDFTPEVRDTIIAKFAEAAGVATTRISLEVVAASVHLVVTIQSRSQTVADAVQSTLAASLSSASAATDLMPAGFVVESKPTIAVTAAPTSGLGTPAPAPPSQAPPVAWRDPLTQSLVNAMGLDCMARSSSLPVLAALVVAALVGQLLAAACDRARAEKRMQEGGHTRKRSQMWRSFFNYHTLLSSVHCGWMGLTRAQSALVLLNCAAIEVALVRSLLVLWPANVILAGSVASLCTTLATPLFLFSFDVAAPCWPRGRVVHVEPEKMRASALTGLGGSDDDARMDEGSRMRRKMKQRCSHSATAQPALVDSDDDAAGMDQVSAAHLKKVQAESSSFRRKMGRHSSDTQPALGDTDDGPRMDEVSASRVGEVPAESSSFRRKRRQRWSDAATAQPAVGFLRVTIEPAHSASTSTDVPSSLPTTPPPSPSGEVSSGVLALPSPSLPVPPSDAARAARGTRFSPKIIGLIELCQWILSWSWFVGLLVLFLLPDCGLGGLTSDQEPLEITVLLLTWLWSAGQRLLLSEPLMILVAHRFLRTAHYDESFGRRRARLGLRMNPRLGSMSSGTRPRPRLGRIGTRKNPHLGSMSSDQNPDDSFPVPINLVFSESAPAVSIESWRKQGIGTDTVHYT